MGNKSKTMLQWHPAFYAGIQIEFEADTSKVDTIPANEKKFEVVDIVCDSLKRIILEQNRADYEQEKQ